MFTFMLNAGCTGVMCFSLPTDIQAEGIPMILGGGDVLMVGTGLIVTK